MLELPQGGSSNKYPQSMFLSRNKKNNVYPCKPQFYYIKVGFKGVKIIKDVSVMIDSMSHIIRKLKFGVNMALTYVCKAF